ncbi:MAG TPA: 7TM diverse intracellular signaling domain-containing protein [Puia sp.]|nr:7TM diverse intracellular signaling domain-containing protein [Puia sp.]
MNILKACLSGLFLLLLRLDSQAQQSQPEVAADISQTGLLDDIAVNTGYYFSNDRNISIRQLPSLPYRQNTRKYMHFMAPELMNKKPVLRFTLVNRSDSVQSVFFCPGWLVDTIQLYRLVPGGPEGMHAEALPRVVPDNPDSLGYRKITLAAHDSATYFATLSYVRAATNSINPSLTRAKLIEEGITLQHKNKTSIDVITNLFAGIMLMMIFYSVSEYIQSKKPEFLYYIGYSICISVLLFLKSTLHQVTTSFNFFFESFLDNIIFSVGYIFYIIFHRKFLETSKHYKPLDRYLFWGSVGIAGLTVLYVLSYFFSADFRIANNLETAIKLVLLATSIIFIIKGLSYHNRLMNYIVMGNISLCLLSIISLVMISTNIKIASGVSVLNASLFHYEVGITIETLFFLFALTYKNKMEIIVSIQKEEKMKLETERKEMEKQVAVLAAKQDERNRISVDMHDELGSGVTAIRLMSEIVKSKMKDQTLPEIDKISNSANELINKMNTIIWTMTSSNDSVENLIAYIRSYAVEFFENTAIDCYFTMPASIPPREISGEKRRNIFLSVKEALNNVLKHSQSSVVKINISVNERLIIEIQDDGIGINMEKLRKFGNGLNNMRKRMASIEGGFQIENQEGTRTTFYLQL